MSVERLEQIANQAMNACQTMRTMAKIGYGPEASSQQVLAVVNNLTAPDGSVRVYDVVAVANSVAAMAGDHLGPVDLGRGVEAMFTAATACKYSACRLAAMTVSASRAQDEESIEAITHAGPMHPWDPRGAADLVIALTALAWQAYAGRTNEHFCTMEEE